MTVNGEVILNLYMIYSCDIYIYIYICLPVMINV